MVRQVLDEDEQCLCQEAQCILMTFQFWTFQVLGNEEAARQETKDGC